GAHTVSFVPLSNFRNILTTVYRVPAVALRLQAMTTNTVPAVPYRGAGRPEAHHVIERLLDMAARRLGMDRAQIRRRNIVTKRELPHRTPMRLVFDSGDFAGYLERALVMADYAGCAARKLIEHGRGEAAERLEGRVDDVTYERGSFRIAGTDRAIGLFALAPLEAAEEINARIPALPAGAAVCELEVEPGTGAVHILRYVSVDDVGQPVNPLTVDGQTHGAIVQGIGQ